jgi:hypothetical protein
MHGCRPRVAQRGRCHHAALCGVVFARCCTAVVFVVSGGGCLCAALCRRCLCAVLHGCRSAVLSSHSVTRLLYSHSVAWRRLGIARGSSSRSIVFTCRRTAAVVFASPLLSQRCHLCGPGHRHRLSPSNQGRRGHIPSRTPANNGGAAQGRGINGATAIPLHRHGPCSRTNGEQGAKRGVPWAKRGVSAFNRGRGQSEGSHTFRAPANGGGCAGAGRNAPASARILFAHERGAQKGAGATQRKGVKGAAALPLHDSGTNPVRAQTGGRAQKGGG